MSNWPTWSCSRPAAAWRSSPWAWAAESRSWCRSGSPTWASLRTSASCWWSKVLGTEQFLLVLTSKGARLVGCSVWRTILCSLATLRGANLSESEAEQDGEHNITELPQVYSGRGNMASQQSAVRLTEVSMPREYNYKQCGDDSRMAPELLRSVDPRLVLAWLCSWWRYKKAWERGTSFITPCVSARLSFIHLSAWYILVYMMTKICMNSMISL